MLPKTLRQWAGIQPPTSLDPASTALILIDFQGEYFNPAKLPIPGGPAAARNAARLMDAAQRLGLKVIHVQHLAANPASPLFAPGSADADFVDPLRPRPGQEVVVKHLPSSFVGTGLDALLRASEVQTLLIAGLMTHMCVDSTARDAVSQGYKVIVAHDACASRDLPAFDGAIIPGDHVHRATLAALADRFADVMDTESLLGLMGR
ncbi:MAG: cysteine hydrolase family protein [Betaproteobacteria bacterium]|nr:cysteine hydrolase family protein [Betaproteobacteria bacterium]